MEAAVPRGLRKIKRERERDRKEERDDVYIYTPRWVRSSARRERCQAAVCSKLFKQNDASRGI